VSRRLSPARNREWVKLMAKEMDRMRRGKSVMDDYGASDPAEFLAVAVEAFFESALELRRRHRESTTSSPSTSGRTRRPGTTRAG